MGQVIEADPAEILIFCFSCSKSYRTVKVGNKILDFTHNPIHNPYSNLTPNPSPKPNPSHSPNPSPNHNPNPNPNPKF